VKPRVLAINLARPFLASSAVLHLEAAASALIRLHNMTGNPGYNDEEQKLMLDAIYVLLGAARGHLTAERINEIKMQVESVTDG
jgi:hypothetical protein